MVTKKLDFNFQRAKPKLFRFRKHYNLINPRLLLSNHPIEYVDSYKFLGLTYDKKLSWRKHLLQLKQDCVQRLNTLQAIGHNKWGANKEVLLKLYSALIQSKINYACINIANIKPTLKKIIEPIQNTGLCIATGAHSHRTTPIASLHCEAPHLPLEHRRVQLSLSYLTNLASYPSFPIYKEFFSTINNIPIIPDESPLNNYLIQKLQYYSLILPKIHSNISTLAN